MRVLVVVALLVALGACADDASARLSDVSVLLPAAPSVAHVLEAYDGCFDWAVSNPGLVRVDVLDACGRRVRVSSALASVARREATWLIGTDRATQMRLRCEIFVDAVASIAIVTTTRTMHKDDVERLDIQAFDQVRPTPRRTYAYALGWQQVLHGRGPRVRMGHHDASSEPHSVSHPQARLLPRQWH